MPSIQWNKQTWDSEESWADGEDGWTFHADACNQPYPAWKQSVVDQFLAPYLGPDVDVLELGPGHGRWSEYMVGHARSVCLVDVSERCINECRHRFGDHPEVTFQVNDGRTLPVADRSVNLVWTFGTFVHIDPQDIQSYMGEVGRVLRPGGRFVIHHAGISGWTRRKSLLMGFRSDMTAERFAEIVLQNHLVLDSQWRRWGANDRFGLAYDDVITIGRSPRGHRRASSSTALAFLHPGSG